MPIALAIAVALLCAYGFVWLFALWVGEHIGKRWAKFDTDRADAVIRPKERIAIHATCERLIQMPAYLKTRDEMVQWMTKELPTLVERERRSRPVKPN